MGISGLVVEYIVAIDVTRVRFPADALFVHLPVPHLAVVAFSIQSKMDTLGIEPRASRNRPVPPAQKPSRHCLLLVIHTQTSSGQVQGRTDTSAQTCIHFEKSKHYISTYCGYRSTRMRRKWSHAGLSRGPYGY